MRGICQLGNKHRTRLGTEHSTEANDDACEDEHAYIDRCTLDSSPAAGDDDSTKQDSLAPEAITEVACKRESD